MILISIGYGKIDGTHLPMQFGPLNRDGGERRLNVLITRAAGVAWCTATSSGRTWT